MFITSIVLPPMIAGSSRALVKTKNEMKKFPCINTKQNKVIEANVTDPDGKTRTRANQEKIRLKVW